MALNTKGHVLLEVIAGLISYALLLSVMIAMIANLSKVNIPPSTVSHELAIKQLQWQMSINNHLYHNEGGYCFNYLTQERCLLIKNERLIMTPGTQIILVGLKNIMLFEKEGGLWVSGFLEEEIIEFFIAAIE